MLTCYIKNNFHETGKDISVFSILITPIVYIVYSIFTFITVFKRRKVQTDRQMKNAIFKYLIYASMYIFFYFPSIILYIVTINHSIQSNTFFSWFSYYCSLATISINLVLCIFRILEGYVKCDWKAFIMNQSLDETLVTENNDIINDEENPAEKFYDNTKSNTTDFKFSTKESIDTIGGITNPMIIKKDSSGKFKRLSSWGKLSKDIFKGVIIFFKLIMLVYERFFCWFNLMFR